MTSRIKIFVAIPSSGLLEAPCAESWFRVAARCGRWAELDFRFISGYSCELARNEAVRQFLMTDARYLWFVDSDIVMAEDAPELLLSAQQEIVTGIYFRKEDSDDPCAEVCRLEEEKTVFFRRSELPDTIFPVAGCGAGCIMIRREVIEKCRQSVPDGRLFVYSFDPLISEDLWFCNLAGSLGYRIWAHGALRLGHLGRKTF